jgi:polysaccharide export outer membrane protein
VKIFCRIGCVILFAMSACATTQRPPRVADQATESSRLQELLAERSVDANSHGYRIGAGDKLHVVVSRADEFTGDYQVAEDGKITMPLIGDIVAVGKGEDQVGSAIADMLRAQYLQSPEVIVTVAGYVGRKATVTGAVAKPGFYDLQNGRETILDLLTRAGGITDDASPKIFFTPGSEGANHGPQLVMASAPGMGLLAGGDDKPIEIDLTDLYEGGTVPALQLPVRTGDVIFVKEGGQVFVEGWVEDPKGYPLKRAMTLTQAISKAGGMHFGASFGGVTLFREDANGVARAYPIDFSALKSGAEKDIYLEPGDKISVAGSPPKVALWSVYNALTSIIRFSIAGGVAAF